MVYQFCSLKEVIARVYRDLDLKDTSRVFDFIEWCADAIERIGAITQYESTVEKLTISNYRVALPCNFHQLNQIYYMLYLYWGRHKYLKYI